MKNKEGYIKLPNGTTRGDLQFYLY